MQQPGSAKNCCHALEPGLGIRIFDMLMTPNSLSEVQPLREQRLLYVLNASDFLE
jgi:hypothetical protein